ncbi:YhcH/YjgK/YiaL family protein [Chryseobacterium sp.]|uniref:YhcH/YjgK/YiaL family protein n=1 Tax=Chryseobacterium sp. TaxID=1871047 RepID=UPI0025B7C2E4|nr:YhcH/YjgK/YiaL family protein [Chryseobacterium sp.]
MIYDKLENIKKYNFDFDFILKNLDTHNFIPGRSDIDSDNQFVIGLEYETKNEEDAIWEAHRKYLDIHVVLEGKEFVHISDIKNMTSTKEYEPDYELFEGPKEHIILLEPGTFLVLFPNEVHKTSVHTGNKNLIRKKVFKSLIV